MKSKIKLLSFSLLCVATLVGCGQNKENNYESVDKTSTEKISESNNQQDSSNIEESSSKDQYDQSSKDEISSADSAEENGITLSKVVGANECAYVEFNCLDTDNVSNYQVSYLLDGTSTYKKIDSELIRKNGTTIRADIVGLKTGKYKIKVENTSNSNYAITSQIKVLKQDRSGYAHFNYEKGVGAYNDDGTLKTGAVVVYVNEENKNTVKAKINNTTYTGISDIITHATEDNVALDVRILGTVGAATWLKTSPSVSGYSVATTTTVKGVNGKYLALQNYSESDIIDGGFNELDESVYTKLNGLTNKIKYDSEKTEFDSYYNMLDVKGAKNVTIEGIGEDACLFQWGFTWKSDCKSIEVKNLTFDDYTEDACSFEGTTDYTKVSDFEATNYWVHNNTFNKGVNYWDVCSEQDKHDGDGSTDIKRCAYVTISYNHYINNHKTGLVGGSDTNKTSSITFHHNYYDRCQSRLPFARQANMHMYNNYYYGSTGNNMQIYAGAYAFIENCYFKNVKNTFTLATSDGKTPAVKSFNNIYDGTSSTGATIVTDRKTTVTNGCIFGNNFDIDPSIFYYDKDNECSDVEFLVDATDVPEFVTLHAGAGSSYYEALNVANEEEINNLRTEKINALNSLILKNGQYYDLYQTKKTECDSIITKYTSLINEATKLSAINNLYNEALVEFNNLTKKSYTVTFMVDSTTYETVTAYENEMITYPTSPTKDGKYLSYWKTESNERFKGYTSSNITVYAVFEDYLSYDDLNNNSNKVVSLDFNNTTDGEKIGSIDVNKLGVYSGTNGQDTSLCYGVYTGSAIKTYDNDSNSAALLGLTLGTEYSSGIVKGYIDLSLGSNTGSKWKLLIFYDKNGKEVLSFGLNDSKVWSYSTDGTNWQSFNVSSQLSAAANTKYSIYYQFDLDNGTVSLFINNKQYMNCVSVNVTKLSYLQTMTNGNGCVSNKERIVTLDNIAIVKEN